MILEDIAQDIVVSNRMVWRKMGNKVVPLQTHLIGRRKGRVVSQPHNVVRSNQYEKTHDTKRQEQRWVQELQESPKNKRMNPASRRVRALNKRRR